MSGEDVQVTFGAQVENFLSGMNRVRFAIEGLTNPLRGRARQPRRRRRGLRRRVRPRKDRRILRQDDRAKRADAALCGATSWAQAWRSILGDMVIWAIEQFEKMAFEWAAHELVKTAATETGVAARTAAEQAGAATSLATMFASILKSIAASVGQVFAGVTAFLAPIMGPAAPAAGAGVAAAVGATAAAAVPMAAAGTNMVMSSGLAVIHEGETIVPARLSGPFRDPGGVGGAASAPVSVSISLSAWDAGSVQNWLKRGGALQIGRALAGAQVLNPSLSTG